eukprot:TRINITY_DN4683_c5_g1_i1.p1 TRINITY_DN4683_c5_g1~~TRINITY_DN4683_c5_g1_i1.p1  ORF type:complete len:974 (+),score=244.16 TRINITY_DN4683_c5_g1_i1:82-3003(+)
MLDIVVHWDGRNQRIRGFGASDAWTPELLAANWRGDEGEAGRRRVEALLFDATLDSDGRPRGIGLTCWRAVLGAGSAATECVTPTWRRTECYLHPRWFHWGLTDQRSYNWRSCPGQQWLLKAAARYRVGHFIAAARSPPATLTVNGLSHVLPDPPGCLGGPKCNLRSELHGLRAGEFAVYLVTVLQYWAKHGVCFAAVTPVNEPHWRWDGSDQEGCAYDNADVRRLVEKLQNQLVRHGVDVSVAVPDAGALDYLVGPVSGKGNHSDFLRDWLQPRAVPAPAIAAVTAHSYFSCWPSEDRLVGTREQLRAAMAPLEARGVEYWMTEYAVCIPEEEQWVPPGAVVALTGERGGARSPASPINRALWAARVIHMDLVVAAATVWCWWLALSPVGAEADGLLEVDPDEPGRIFVRKPYYALGHWSFFVREGFSRLSVTRSDMVAEREAAEGLMVSAFAAADGRVVVVMVHFGHQDIAARIGVAGLPNLLQSASTFSLHVTSDSADLHPCGAVRLGEPIRVPARSIVTASGDVVENGGVYHLIPESCFHSTNQRALEVCLASKQPCALVGLGTLHRSRAGGYNMHQAWTVVGVEPEEAGAGHCNLICAHSALVMEVVNGVRTPKAPLHQVGGTGAPHQQWRLERTPCGALLLCARHSGHALEVDGERVFTAPRTGRASQQWRLLRAGTLPPDAPSADPPRTTAAEHAAELWQAGWRPGAPDCGVPLEAPVRRYPLPDGGDPAEKLFVHQAAPSSPPPARQRRVRREASSASIDHHFGAQRTQSRLSVQLQQQQLERSPTRGSDQQQEWAVGGLEAYMCKQPTPPSPAPPPPQQQQQQQLADEPARLSQLSLAPATVRQDFHSVPEPPPSPERLPTVLSLRGAPYRQRELEVTLAVPKEDCDATFRRLLTDSIARELKIGATEVSVRFVAFDASGTKVAISLLGEHSEDLLEGLRDLINTKEAGSEADTSSLPSHTAAP